jgi:acylpyruvate hydrolase
MRFVAYVDELGPGLAVKSAQGHYHGLPETELGGDLLSLIKGEAGALRAAADRLGAAPVVDLEAVQMCPPLRRPGKIICIGLNYADHSAESGFEVPDYPTVFARFSSGLIAHGDPIIRPRLSEQLDFEGELVAIVGKGGRNIPVEKALDHVAGYSIFNDGSVRDYQFKAPQWTVGKNFDGTGAFGPEFVSADELPDGCEGLRIETRLNGEIVQKSSIDLLIFSVASLVSTLSEAMTLEPGDLIVTGTPAGVGLARTPKLWMKPGDVCEVEIEGIGVLRNPIADEK